MAGEPDVGGLRIREAVRALVLDPDDRLLLVRFEFPVTGTRWALPGGGLEPGETHVEALRRELVEEVGLRDAEIGPHIWTRLHVIEFIDGRYDGQRERIHLVRTDRFEPTPALGPAELEAEYVFELRWWTLDDITGSGGTDLIFVPAALGALARDIATHGAPASPVEVSV
ncbi:MAG: NUDIX domain-containing protein [Ilumatobacteraceae bacterium]